MAELSTGGAGENGVLTVKTEDDQVAARLSTTSGVIPVEGGGVVAAPGAGGRRHPGGIGDPIAVGGAAIGGVVGTPMDSFELGHAGRAAAVVVRGVSGDPTISSPGCRCGWPGRPHRRRRFAPGTPAGRRGRGTRGGQRDE